MGILSKLWRGVKKVAGTVAAIAAPFIAAPIAGLMGISGVVGTSLVGAGIGALGSSLAGGDPLTGALIGGLGGFAGAGGFKALGLGAGGQAGLAVPGATGATTGAAGAAAAPAVATAAPMTLGSALKGLASNVLSNPAGLAQLAVTVFGRPPQDLTDIERQRLEELKELAARDRELFEQRVMEAQSLLRSADQQAPDLEGAYGEARLGLERRLSEANRGLSRSAAAANERRAALSGAKAGATAAAAERQSAIARQTNLRTAGLNAMPTSVPEGPVGLSLPIYESLNKRRQAYTQDLARGVGGLFGDREDIVKAEQDNSVTLGG